jgi:hypothetical protein
MTGRDEKREKRSTALLVPVERRLVMLRHVPPRQVARRLELTVRRRLAPWLANGLAREPAPVLAPQLPQPIFASRLLLEPSDGGWRFWQPWGSIELPPQIDWQLPGDDPKTVSWRVNLHFMEFLEAVDDPAFVAIVSDWIDKNPLHAGDAWRCAWWSYNLAIRVVVWMQQIAARRHRLPDAFVAEAAASLAQHLRFLERHLETDLRGNHLMRNLKALLWAGAFFTGPESDRWWRKGEALLESELAWQILDDGCHYERSPSYHCQVFGDLLEVASLCRTGRRLAGPLEAKLLAALDRMATAAMRLTHPDGGVTLFNDGGLGMAYRTAELLQAFSRADRPAPTPAAGAFALAAGGYYGLQGPDELLVVDCGAVGPDELIGHGHGDILTFEWSVGGRRIVVDQGTFQYAASPEREQSRSSKNHNTVVIDDAEQCDFYGAHRCGRRARPIVLGYEGAADRFVLEGTHDGFDRLPGRPRHVRRFEATPGRLRITDRIESAASHAGEAGLLLHPECRVDLAGNTATITNGPVVVRLSSSVPLTAEPAEWFPNLYTRQPTTRLRQTLADMRSELVTELRHQVAGS